MRQAIIDFAKDRGVDVSSDILTNDDIHFLNREEFKQYKNNIYRDSFFIW
jgi:hypothetical protein